MAGPLNPEGLARGCFTYSANCRKVGLSSNVQLLDRHAWLIFVPEIIAAPSRVMCLDLSDLGDEPAHLLGARVINAFRQIADTFPTPVPYHLVIDEFQNFGTGVISTILSESGRYLRSVDSLYSAPLRRGFFFWSGRIERADDAGEVRKAKGAG